MRTFISDNIQKIIDLGHKKLDTSVTERCESITGGALRILGRMPGEVKFCKNKKTYVGNFLVCTNIGYDCVLGWDFLVHNNLDLQWERFRGTRSYHLVGSHGKTRVSAVGFTKSSNKSVSGILEASLGTEKAPKFEASDDFLLAQSNIKAPVFVALENNVIIQGIISPSNSPWSSLIVLVKKRNGEFRFCVDYRRLNEVTENDSHPLPNIADILDSLGNSRYFSTLDLRNGYWQIEIDPKDPPKSAFTTSFGLFQFDSMSFGLKTAPATFQRAMEIVLAGLKYDSCLCYLDDVIFFGRDLRKHNVRLQAVLSRFRQHNLRVKLCKCQFAATEVSFLGHRVSQDGVSADPEKVAAIRNISRPGMCERCA